MAAQPISENLYHDQIDAIRKRGGDVIMSFGGEAGKEMANVIDDPVGARSGVPESDRSI